SGTTGAGAVPGRHEDRPGPALQDRCWAVYPAGRRGDYRGIERGHRSAEEGTAGDQGPAEPAAATAGRSASGPAADHAPGGVEDDPVAAGAGEHADNVLREAVPGR